MVLGCVLFDYCCGVWFRIVGGCGLVGVFIVACLLIDWLFGYLFGGWLVFIVVFTSLF